MCKGGKITSDYSFVFLEKRKKVTGFKTDGSIHHTGEADPWIMTGEDEERFIRDQITDKRKH